jgi:hypothetical protein
MHESVHIAITPLVVDADPETLAHRTAIAQRLQNLDLLDAADGEVNTTEVRGWQVTVNDAITVPLVDFAVSPAEGDGQALVSLVVPADMVSVGRSPASAPAPAVDEKPLRVGTWGQAGVPDPREKIPGWCPDQPVRPRAERLGLVENPPTAEVPA